MLELVRQEQPQQEVTFDDMWLLYPKKVARKDALKAWNRLSPKDKVCAITALVDWRRVWMQRDPQYVPHCSSWLNGERFHDELPEQFVQSRPAAQAEYRAQEQTERADMPEQVRALLAKMRGGK